jgi:hypothetical protein
MGPQKLARLAGERGSVRLARPPVVAGEEVGDLIACLVQHGRDDVGGRLLG